MSKIASLVRRLVAIAFVGAVSLGVPACGGGGSHYDPYLGTLEVRNDNFSIFGIDTVEVSQPFGPIDAYDLFLAPGERDFIDLSRTSTTWNCSGRTARPTSSRGSRSTITRPPSSSARN